MWSDSHLFSRNKRDGAKTSSTIEGRIGVLIDAHDHDGDFVVAMSSGSIAYHKRSKVKLNAHPLFLAPAAAIVQIVPSKILSIERAS